MDGLHPMAKYRLVALARLVGMQLAVMVNNQHYQHVKNVSFDTVGTGLLGKMVRKLIFNLFICMYIVQLLIVKLFLQSKRIFNFVG